MFSVVAALLLSVPAASTGELTLSVGEPAVFSQTDQMTFWHYPVTVDWGISCAAAVDTLIYRFMRFGALDENGLRSSIVKVPPASRASSP